MDQKTFDERISERIKLIRTEAGLTQDGFAEMIGISKKTLVEVEKGRKTVGFTAAVAVSVLFRNGEIIRNVLGDAVFEIIDLCARNSSVKTRSRTLGGHVFWTIENEKEGYKIQQNRITGHYRIIDPENYLIFYSFNREEVNQRFKEILKQRG
jgi:DNA-binding XRE family transcriptional regulator